MLTDDMKRIVREQRLGFVATADPDGRPNLSPKGTFAVIDDATIGFGEIRSPGTMRNLAANPAIEVNFVDPFVRTGYRFAGMATVLIRGSAPFDRAVPLFADYGNLVNRMNAVVTIAVERALPITSPAYDDGEDAESLRKLWTRRFRTLQPGGRFVGD